MTQFNWAEVPKTHQGFVNYKQIRSHSVRLMLANAERSRIIEELDSREQQDGEFDNARMNEIKGRLNLLERHYPEAFRKC